MSAFLVKFLMVAVIKARPSESWDQDASATVEDQRPPKASAETAFQAP